jgi:hypothetical protein
MNHFQCKGNELYTGDVGLKKIARVGSPVHGCSCACVKPSKN